MTFPCYPEIPSEYVEDKLKPFVEAMLEQCKIEKCDGTLHFFMIRDGSSITSDFIPDALRTKENLRRIKKELVKYLNKQIRDASF